MIDITEIRIFLKEGQDKKLKGYATVTFDHAFVVRNIKVIAGSHGLFVAMPSRKLKLPCRPCGFKNEVGSKFCNECGAVVPTPTQEEIAMHDSKADHRDIAHPITHEFREILQNKILESYKKESTGSLSIK